MDIAVIFFKGKLHWIPPSSLKYPNGEQCQHPAARLETTRDSIELELVTSPLATYLWRMVQPIELTLGAFKNEEHGVEFDPCMYVWA
jgi:hypothetical protein